MKISNLDIIDTLNPEYGSSEFCSLLFYGRCRYSLEAPKISKCDECYLFNSKLAGTYQKVLRRYNNKEIKKNEN